MALTNKSMYAILGILNISSGTGYDIKKYCDKVLSGFWNENYGHIYPTLKSMLNEGTIEIISGEGDAESRRIVYGITKKGKSELKSWLEEDTENSPVRSEFMLKLLFSSSEPTDSTVRMLKYYKAAHEENIKNYKAMQRDMTNKQEISSEREVYMNAILRRGILSSEATVKWCDETIETISSQRSSSQK